MFALRRFNAHLDYHSSVVCGSWISGILFRSCVANPGSSRPTPALFHSPTESRPRSTHPSPMATVQAAKAPAQVKPPNVLVLQSLKDSTTQEFSRIRDALESCLTPERYVVYPLGVDEVQQRSPWQDNCRLLLVLRMLSPLAPTMAQVLMLATMRRWICVRRRRSYRRYRLSLAKEVCY